jgi:hypothetical protein
MHAIFMYSFVRWEGTPVEKKHCSAVYSVGYLGADQVRIFAKSVPYGV